MYQGQAKHKVAAKSRGGGRVRYATSPGQRRNAKDISYQGQKVEPFFAGFPVTNIHRRNIQIAGDNPSTGRSGQASRIVLYWCQRQEPSEALF